MLLLRRCLIIGGVLPLLEICCVLNGVCCLLVVAYCLLVVDWCSLVVVFVCCLMHVDASLVFWLSLPVVVDGCMSSRVEC